MSWQWDHPYNFRLPDGRTINILSCSEGEWMHVVRDGARRALWTRAAARRQDMQGIEMGIDRYATQCAIQQCRIPYRRGMTRSIVAGAVMTQDRLHRAHLVDT
eukprot:5230141-Karenia_brevis.AAC.1